MENKNFKLIRIIQTGIFAALCFVSFTFIQIKIPIPGGDATSLHIGNAFCVLAALLIGGWYGGLAGAIGMSISDLIDPVYYLVAPKTFILKLCIGLITGVVAHKYAKINESNDSKYITRWVVIASILGLLFNTIFDPVVGYFYKQYILGQPQEMAKILAQVNFVTTAINSVVSIILASLLYKVLRKILINSDFFIFNDKIDKKD